jgi:hypothetical protein
MKKIYAKPMVSFESFAFSSNIAAGCSSIPGLHGDGTCPSYGTQSSPEDGCTFFNDGVHFFTDFCMRSPEEDNKHDLCYHVSTDATRVFMS